MSTPQTSAPGLTPQTALLDGARLFVASYRVSRSELSRVWRCGFHALLWSAGGQATLACDGEPFGLSGPALVCISPGQVYEWTTSDDEARAILVGFDADIFTAGRGRGGVLDVQLLHGLPHFRPDGTTVLPAAEHAEILGELFERCRARYRQLSVRHAGGSWRVLPREHEGVMLAHLHVLLAEAAALSSPQEPVQPSGDRDLQLSRLFRLHAEQRVLDRLPVAAYADLLHITPDHLTRAVKRTTGRTPSAWLHEHLLVEARRRLVLTGQPVEQVAEALNFGSASQFSQWVRARTGLTPRQLRRSAHGNSTLSVGT